jgi:hypothetical protein
VEKPASHYADDASFLLNDMPIQTGKAAIAALWKDMLAMTVAIDWSISKYLDLQRRQNQEADDGEGQVADGFPQAGGRLLEVCRGHVHGRCPFDAGDVGSGPYSVASDFTI